MSTPSAGATTPARRLGALGRAEFTLLVRNRAGLISSLFVPLAMIGAIKSSLDRVDLGAAGVSAVEAAMTIASVCELLPATGVMTLVRAGRLGGAGAYELLGAALNALVWTVLAVFAVRRWFRWDPRR